MPPISADRPRSCVLRSLRGRIAAFFWAEIVAGVLDDAVRSGVHYLVDAIVPPVSGGARLEDLRTRSGQHIRGDTFIFACGHGCHRSSPRLLGTRIFPTRQRFLFRKHRLVRVNSDRRSCQFAASSRRHVRAAGHRELRVKWRATARRALRTESGNRTVGERGLREVRAYLRCRLPELKESPCSRPAFVNTRNTSNGDFLIDRHLRSRTFWLVAGVRPRIQTRSAMGQHVAAGFWMGQAGEAILN